MWMPSNKVLCSLSEKRVGLILLVAVGLSISLIASSLRATLAGPEDDAIEHDVLVKKITYNPIATSAETEKKRHHRKPASSRWLPQLSRGREARYSLITGVPLATPFPASEAGSDPHWMALVKDAARLLFLPR